jgi:hypothetical protein
VKKLKPRGATPGPSENRAENVYNHNTTSDDECKLPHNGNGFAHVDPGFAVDKEEGRRLYNEYFKEHGIPLGVADFICELLSPTETAALTGYKVWSIRIHYWNSDGSKVADFARVRFLQVRRKDEPADGRPAFRYWQPPDSGSRLYQPVPVYAYVHDGKKAGRMPRAIRSCC